jgi:hypothetical protein
MAVRRDQADLHVDVTGKGILLVAMSEFVMVVLE